MRHLAMKFPLLTLTLLLSACLNLSCGWSRGGPALPVPPSPSPSPSPSPAPDPSPVPTPPPSSQQMPNMGGGSWSGTLESSSFSTRTIAARFIQMADCVDGSWNTADFGSRWVGAISAFVGPGSLRSGFMSFEFPGSGSKLCTGVGTLAGDATSDRATLTWTMTGYNTDTCTSGVPNLMLIKLQRQ